MKKLLIVLAGLLFLTGGALIYGSNFAKDFINTQLSAQQITFPSNEVLVEDGRQDLVKYADQQVLNGDQAKAFSSYIEGHLSKVADGKTYSQVSSEWVKDMKNAELAQKRQTLFMGETLRGILLSVWGWSLVASIAMYAGLGLWLAAVALVVVYLVLPEKTRATKKKK